MNSFEKHVSIWARRLKQMGDNAVGRKGEDMHGQAKRIAGQLEQWLPIGLRFEHGLDLGCGWGRFTGRLAEHCGHLWAVDVFQEWVDRAAGALNTTPVCLNEATLPMADRSMNLIVDLQTLQSLDGALLIRYSKELKRVAAKGATVISLHMVKPEPLRSPDQRAKLLGLKAGYTITTTDEIDQAKDAYTFLVGVRD